MKLTDAQRKVLARMEAGETLHRGATQRQWWLEASEPCVRTATAEKLLQHGLITRTGSRVGVCVYYGITDAGRAALKQE